MTGKAATLAPGPQAVGLRRLLGNASLVGAGTLFQQALSFASGLVVARMLGAAEYGMFNLARNLADLAGIVSRCGLDIGLQRHLGEDSSPAARAAQAAVLARLRLLVAGFACLPAILVLLGAGAALESGLYRYERFAETLLCLLLVLPFATDLAVLGGAYRGALRLAPSVLAEYFLLPALRLIAIVALFLAGWRLPAVIAGSMLATAAASLCLAARARRDFPTAAAASAGSWRDAWGVVRYSSVLSAAVLVTTLTAAMDLLLLGHFASAQETGQYALAKTLLLLVGVCGVAFGQGLGAQVAGRHARGDPHGAAAAVKLTVRWIALGTAPVFALFLFWGVAATRLFGPSFELPQAVVAWLACAQYLVAVLGPAGWVLSMTGRHCTELGILSAGLLVAVLCGGLAIPAFGQLGAAVSTAAAIAVATIGRVLFARRALGRLTVGRDVAVVTATAVGLAALVAWLAASLPWPAAARAAAGAGGFLLAYGACAWRLLLERDERQQLRDAGRALAGRLAGGAR
ncbi:MAG: lipopolysaccharide biosynthesis protein [Steroidobacteraceae bacterium]